MDETVYMAEFAENLWNNYIKQKMVDELQQNVSYYRATVVSNPQDGTLNVQRPYDNAFRIRCADDLKSVSAGTMVTVLVFGKGNATNHIAISADSMKDIRVGTVSIANGGTGATTLAGARSNLGISDVLPIESGGTGATTAAEAMVNLGAVDYVIEEGNSATQGLDTTQFYADEYSHIYWRKWNSGWVEIQGMSHCTNNAYVTNSSWGNGFSSDYFTLWGEWPVAFASPPVVNFRVIAVDSNEYTGDYMIIWNGPDMSKDLNKNSPKFKFWRGTQKTIGHPKLEFSAVGMWK